MPEGNCSKAIRSDIGSERMIIKVATNVAGEDKNLDSVLFDQIDDALEERDGGDRRKQNAAAAPAVAEDRRKNDRRNEND